MILIYFVGAVLVVALIINLFKNDDEINKRTLKYLFPAFIVVSILFASLFILIVWIKIDTNFFIFRNFIDTAIKRF